ncbi:MAG: HAD family phosphatase [Dehalococcoidia bacterium]|nr:HAD family phosphatase [Dehalococcoidia bacterium]NUQ54832.1 HAD family phosphatase [Dehalococcoidia bacterium]RIL01489.1 MAG: HAD family hydrolase [bacterium]
MLNAAIFDIGGVLTHSPVTAIIDFCRTHGIPDETRFAIFGPEDGPWSRFERSELTPAEFAAVFEEHARPAGSAVSGEEFMRWFFQGFGPRPEMIAVVRHLRGKVRLGAITNNVARDEPPERRTSGVAIHELFEVVVESAIAGVRKPEPRIYQIACEQLGVEPQQAVFLDDMGANLKGARALGMTTIKVDHTLSAIGELEAALGIPLPRP